jgi:hypothetical protein
LPANGSRSGTKNQKGGLVKKTTKTKKNELYQVLYCPKVGMIPSIRKNITCWKIHTAD